MPRFIPTRSGAGIPAIQDTAKKRIAAAFFVDKDGNIVGDPIMGSNTFDGWKEAVEKQLAALKGE